MGLRETLNENPAITTAATALIIIVALGFALAQFMRGGDTPPTVEAGERKSYFTVDDGKSWFEAPATNVPPFDHEGKTAVRARLYTCDGGENKFVGYLERYTPAARQRIEQQDGVPTLMDMEDPSAVEVKRPGGNRWVPRDTPEGYRVRDVTCPDGTTDNLEAVPEPL